MGIDLNKSSVSQIIERFINGDGEPYEWDDFTSVKILDPELEQIRQKCIVIRDDHPPRNKNEYCNEKGIKELKAIMQELKKKLSNKAL